MDAELNDDRGAADGGDTVSVDPPGDRPGVPMEASPEEPAEGAHWARPERQRTAGNHLVRAGLERPTPVVGTAQPPRGVSGSLRRAAYRIPEHFARHWALLMLADRVDVVEDRLGSAMAGPMEQVGFETGAHVARKNPLGVLAGAVVGAWLAKRLL